MAANNHTRWVQQLKQSNAAGQHARGVRRERSRTDARRAAIRHEQGHQSRRRRG